MVKNIWRRLSLASLALLSGAQAASAATWTSTAQYGYWDNGGYRIGNNVWNNAHHGPQSIWANSYSNWGVWSQQPNGYGVNSYPNSGRMNINKKISAYNGTGAWNITVPTTGTNYYNASYDVWVPTEVMIWVYKTSGVGPRGSLQASNVSIAGHTWNVYRENSQWNVISYVRTSNSTAGSVNIRQMLDYSRNRGWLGDGTIGANQFGFEISGTSNVGRDFRVNSMSIGN